jgi:hypothetical protein
MADRDRDDQNPLTAPRQHVDIQSPLDDPRAHAAASVADPDELDAEDNRRLRNLRRRILQRPGRRARYLERIYEIDRALYDELCELRKLSPQAFRKRIQHEARRLKLHLFLRHGPRELPPEE